MNARISQQDSLASEHIEHSQAGTHENKLSQIFRVLHKESSFWKESATLLFNTSKREMPDVLSPEYYGLQIK